MVLTVSSPAARTVISGFCHYNGEALAKLLVVGGDPGKDLLGRTMASLGRKRSEVPRGGTVLTSPWQSPASLRVKAEEGALASITAAF